MLYNIIIILLIIGVVFLMTKSDKLGKKYNKHSGKLIFFLLVLYMLVNKIYHGVAVLAVIFLLYYHKEIRKRLNIQKIDMKFLKDNVERFVNPELSDNEEPKEEEEKKQEEGGDIFNEIDKLEEVATNSDKIATEPFKDMVSDLRKSFDAIYNKLGEQK
jgi:predicted membrane protein